MNYSIEVFTGSTYDFLLARISRFLVVSSCSMYRCNIRCVTCRLAL